jgi:nudix-type nucleoside diphosphatase (YffH/AdpP family)
MPADITNIETVYKGWGRYSLATIRLAEGRVMRREIEDHGAAACVLPYDPERKTAMLVRQFRAPVFLAAHQEETLEAIAGIVEDPDPIACARREALEEAGLELGMLEHVVTGWTMPGISTERMSFYLATYSAADRVRPRGGRSAGEESVTPIELGLSELAAMADTGRLVDVKTLLLTQTLRLRRPQLFAR